MADYCPACGAPIDPKTDGYAARPDAAALAPQERSLVLHLLTSEDTIPLTEADAILARLPAAPAEHNVGSCVLCTGQHDEEEAAFMNHKAAARSAAEGSPAEAKCVKCETWTHEYNAAVANGYMAKAGSRKRMMKGHAARNHDRPAAAEGDDHD